VIQEDVFIHPTAIVEPGATIGTKTRVWAFVHILPGAVVGEDCNICDHVFIENDIIIGDRVTVKCGIYLWDGVRIEDDVHLGPNVVFTNDRYPRSKQAFELARTVVRRGASIGANATVLPGIEVGEAALIGAGSVVTRSVPAFALVLGNPARQVGHVCVCGQRLPEIGVNDEAVCRNCARAFISHQGNLTLKVDTSYAP
jgi:UDP-2-acetamido-3-amino-2,3-dideoxy-glucuronate N-acetyltransferase